MTEGTIVKCHDCDLSYTNPMLSELLDVDQYVNPEIGYGRLDEPGMLYWEDQVLCLNELMQQLQSPHDTILDFACGKGGFVYLCERENLQVKGIDLSSPCIEAGRRHGVRNIHCADLEDEANNSYDAVVALHVLEHCRNIQPLADDLRRVLKPGGKLLIMVPNYGSAQSSLKPKRYWAEAYMHVNGLTARHLDRVFLGRGFKRLPLRCPSGPGKASEIMWKTGISMILTRYLGNYLNVFPTKLFCIYQLAKPAETQVV